MGKIIIDNRSSLSDKEAAWLALKVIDYGRISNNGKQYCYGTVFNYLGNEYGVWSDLNKKSDKLTITNQPK